MARPRFAVMTITERAAERARGLIANATTPVLGLRIGVEKGGCAGMSYSVAFAEAKQPLDEVVEEKGVTIVVDAKAVLFLLGTEIDFATEKLKSGFVFRNPNQTDACGCGKSVTIKPAEAVE